MKRPADVYQPSPRPCPSSLPDLEYPEHDDAVRVNRDGMIYLFGRQQYFAAALAGHYVGLREERDGRWLVTFLDLDLGHFGPGRKFTPIEASNPPEAS